MTRNQDPKGKSRRLDNPEGTDRVAVIDIGSNSVRLVVYDGRTFIPVPFFNEKVLCGLGRDIGATGRLNAEGVEMAFDCMTRFVGLARAMDVGRLDLLATAAVREASDGEAFVAGIRDRFGLETQVLSGEEEAQLSALGVMVSHAGADGIMGDVGGGSLDLVALNGGAYGDESATLPLGALRLAEAAKGGLDAARDYIDGHLDTVDWLGDALGRTFFPVGGAWRAFARVALEQSRYPLHVIDGFTLARRQAEDLAEVVSHLSKRSLQDVTSVSRRRKDTLPLAALLLERVLKRAKPAKVTFSGFGMREGQYFKTLIPEARATDPLLNACRGYASHHPRFGVVGDELRDWMAPLFPDEEPDEARIRYAACLISDISWLDHPDYRAEQAFRRVLRLPFAGLTHGERAVMALTILVRHRGNRDFDDLDEIRHLFTPESERRGRIIGLALRLAYSLCGGLGGLVGQTRLKKTASKLVLMLPSDDGVFHGEAVERRLAAVAELLDLDSGIEVEAG